MGGDETATARRAFKIAVTSTLHPGGVARYRHVSDGIRLLLPPKRSSISASAAVTADTFTAPRMRGATVLSPRCGVRELSKVRMLGKATRASTLAQSPHRCQNGQPHIVAQTFI